MSVGRRCWVGALAVAALVGACSPVATIDVPEIETVCDDGRDDDLDGRFDCFDDDCAAVCEAGRVSLRLIVQHYRALIGDATVAPMDPPVEGAEVCVHGQPAWPCATLGSAGVGQIDVPVGEPILLRFDAVGFPTAWVAVQIDETVRGPLLLLPMYSTSLLREQYRIHGLAWDDTRATLVVGLLGAAATLAPAGLDRVTRIVADPPPADGFVVDGDRLAFAAYPADVDEVSLALDPPCPVYPAWTGWPNGDGTVTVPTRPGGVTVAVFECRE